MTRIGFLFDLDGVLIDSESEYTRIWEEIECRYPTGIPDFASVIKGMTLDKILADYFPDTSTRRGVEYLLYKLEKEMTYRFASGVENFLEKMIASGIPRVVVTSSNADKMAHLYNDIPNFRKIFPVIIDSSKVKKSKPDPEGYLLGASSINFPAEDCVVFEDSVQGVMAGRNSGAFVVGICGTKTAKELSPYSDLIVYGFDELSISELTKKLEKRK